MLIRNRGPARHCAAAQASGVWVLVEQQHGEPHDVSWELLGEGRRLADTLATPLTAVVAGAAEHGLEAAAGRAVAYGADLVRILEDGVLRHYRTAAYASALAGAARAHRPAVLLLGATPLGRDLAGAVATDLETGLTADCTQLASDPESGCLASTRPTFGGSLLCTIETRARRPQMATVRPGVMPRPEPDASRQGSVIRERVDLAEHAIVSKVLAHLPEPREDGARLVDARIVVSGGRGLGRRENLALVRGLAQVLGGEMGVSRPLVQAGWAAHGRQIGQTGHTVRPSLYIAAGISGAVQHRVGMENAEIIVAINTDPDAPIFDIATYGIVADATSLLPALSDAFSRARPDPARAGEGRRYG
ncbi:MAG TPA: electron transfer flavoprotein subunit alpha/FixB family protein [Gammaproteobacteria bacterium]|nr:electron transfer flavoprotein subunit alpha/FixB family protein [Gammaproteobacteria bacterium]